MTGEPARNGDPLAPAAARLIARYGQLIGDDTVRQVLHETYDALLAAATVTTFLPILAERSAATRLAREPPRSDPAIATMPPPNPRGQRTLHSLNHDVGQSLVGAGPQRLKADGRNGTVTLNNPSPSQLPGGTWQKRPRSYG